MNKDRDKKKNIMPGVILVAFVAAVGTFFLLLNMEKNALTAYEKVTVWSTNCELAKGLEITQSCVGDCFIQVEIDKTKVPGKVIENPEQLVGNQTAIAIPNGTILTEPMFRSDITFVEGMHTPVIAGCKGEDLFQLVSGVLRKGDLVHIYTVNKEIEETYLLWENIMVYQAFDTSGNAILAEDVTTPAARVNLLLEEGYTEQFYNELNTGSLRLVKVWD